MVAPFVCASVMDTELNGFNSTLPFGDVDHPKNVAPLFSGLPGDTRVSPC